MSIVGHLWRPHDVTGRRLTAEDFAREARYMLAGARRDNRLLHGRVVASRLEASLRPCGVPVGAGNEIAAPSAMRVGIADEARTPVAGLPCKETEMLPGPSPSNDTPASSIREVARLMLPEVNRSQGCRLTATGTPARGHAHPIGPAVLTAVRQEWRLQRARGACFQARTGAR